MRDVVLKIVKKLGLDCPIQWDNNDIIINDDINLPSFPVQYVVTDRNILIKYSTVPYFKKISLEQFKKLIIRRTNMKTDSDIDLLWKSLEAFVNHWGCGAMPLPNDPENKTIHDAIKSHWNKVNQSKTVAKVSADLKKQVEEMKVEETTKKGDNKTKGG